MTQTTTTTSWGTSGGLPAPYTNASYGTTTSFTQSANTLICKIVGGAGYSTGVAFSRTDVTDTVIDWVDQVTLPGTNEWYVSLYVQCDQYLGNGYYLSFSIGTAQIYKKVGNTSTGLGTAVSDATIAKNATLKFRIHRDVSSGKIQARWWTGATEPSTWQIDLTDSSYTTAGGFAGEVESGSASGTYTLTFASGGVVTFGTDTPPPPTDYGVKAFGGHLLKAFGTNTLRRITAAVAYAVEFTTPIPASPVLDANSATLAELLVGDTAGQQGLLGPQGIIWTAQTSDPQITITPTQSPSAFSSYNPVRVPANACPADSDDAWLAITDPARGLHFEFWQAHWSGSGIACTAANVFELNSDGTIPLYPTVGVGAGAGVGFAQGLVTFDELTAGEINHALYVGCPVGNVKSTYRYPATKTDGTMSGTVLEEGMRIQLNPTLNPDDYPAMSAAERKFMVCLQKYGAYILDRADTGTTPKFTISGQGIDLTDPAQAGMSSGSPYGNPGNPWRTGGEAIALGLPYSYYEFPNIPWRTGTTSNMRVLANWDGS